jgi:dienelactone hydrolase
MLRTLFLVGGLGLLPKPAYAPPQPVAFVAADGVNVYGNSYVAGSPDAPVILLFHQADSGKSEYAPIAPRLVELGYNAVAVDLRSGGDMYAPPNETVQHLGRSATDFRATLPDMDAALAWVRKAYPHAPVYAWGSSFSAALVFAFAAKHPHDVKAVIAFSPNEWIDQNKHFVRDAARRLTVPVFVDSAANAEEEREAKAIYDEVGSRDKVDYVPQNGIHGSSTLRDDRDASGSAENWDAVTRFLTHVTATLHG